MGVDLAEPTCNMMFSTAESMVAMLEGTANTLKGMVDSIISMISSLSWTPRAEFLRVMNQVSGEAEQYLPDLKDADEITRLINACNFLNDISFGMPSALMNSIYDEAMGIFDETILALASMLPEIILSKFIDAVYKMLKTAKVPDILDRTMKALKCLQEICGRDVVSLYDRVMSVLDMLYLDGTGEFDLLALLQAGGVTDPAYIANAFDARNNWNILKAKYDTAYKKVIKDIKDTTDWNDLSDLLPPAPPPPLPNPDSIQDPFV